VKSIRIQQALVAMGFAGVIAIFLPFVWETSPLDTISDGWPELWGLSLPLFLAVSVSAGLIRIFVLGKMTAAESVIAYIMGAIGVVAAWLWAYLGGAGYEEFAETLIEGWYLFYAITIIIGAVMLFLGLRRRWFGEFAPIVAMQIAYIAHGSWLLVVFYEDGWDIGAHVTLFAAVVYLVQMPSYPKGRQSVP